MNTEILSEKEHTLSEICAACTKVWKSGELAAFPTETVYGLGGNGLDPEASRKIYAAKGRPSDNPLILHIAKRSQLPELVREIPEQAEKLMDAFWPGPLTIIFRKSDLVPKETSGGLDTVAVRMPSHRVAQALLLDAGIPIAAPSANLSGRPSPTKCAHVAEDLMGRIPLIIDGDASDIGLESTIVDVTGDHPVLLRPGFITLQKLSEVIGTVTEDPAITNQNIISHQNAVLHPKAPGMKYRHYAPKAPVTVVSGTEEEMIQAIRKVAGEHTGIITVDEHLREFGTGISLSVGTRKEPESIAHGLFSVLRAFDSLPVTEIYAEDFTASDIGTAVMNRLLKAAGGNFRTAREMLADG